MTDIARLESALIKADAAGDTDGARVLAAEIRRMRSAPVAEKPVQQQRMPDTAEVIAANPLTRFALGVSAPFRAAAEMFPDALGGKYWQEKNQQIADMVKAGSKAYPWYVEATGIGADIAGNVMSPAALKVAKAIPSATALPQSIAGGVALGGMTPVGESADFAAEKLKQMGVGAATGTLIPAAYGGVKMVGGVIRDIADLVLPKGAERIATRHQAKIIGKDNIEKVRRALLDAKEYVLGSKPTAAQAVAALPEGSPVIAQQEITSKTPGGVSAMFGQRKLDQAAARQMADDALDAATKPMREAALSAAGKVNTSGIVQKIDDIAARPEFEKIGLVDKTLGALKEKLADPTISAQGLYNVRKEIGNTIKANAVETKNWDKRLAAKLEREVQLAIDDAIESAGGTGWKEYLSKYSAGKKLIEADVQRAKEALRPIQRTNLGGGVNVAEETRTHLPQMLSRPMMLANAVLKTLAGKKGGIEPQVDMYMARQQLDPALLAADLLKAQQASTVEQIVNEIVKRGSLASAQQAAKGE